MTQDKNFTLLDYKAESKEPALFNGGGGQSGSKISRKQQMFDSQYEQMKENRDRDMPKAIFRQ